MIRKANTKDIKGIIALLHQVNMVHHVIRPDLFKPNTTKYNEQELETLLSDDSKPVFVYDDGEIRGHAFCQVNEVRDHRLLVNVKTLYIDDICVDESERGKHIGQCTSLLREHGTGHPENDHGGDYYMIKYENNSFLSMKCRPSDSPQ